MPRASVSKTGPGALPVGRHQVLVDALTRMEMYGLIWTTKDFPTMFSHRFLPTASHPASAGFSLGGPLPKPGDPDHVAPGLNCISAVSVPTQDEEFWQRGDKSTHEVGRYIVLL